LVIVAQRMRVQARLDTQRFRKEEQMRIAGRLRERVAVACSLAAQAHRADTVKGGGNQTLAAALRQAGMLRFDGGSGYVWVHDTTRPFPRMVMHPIKPHLNGAMLDDSEYMRADGRNPFVVMNALCDSAGEGFVEYAWPRPDKDALANRAAKLSFVHLYKPLGLVFGSGVYLDDVEQAAAARTKRIEARISRAVNDIMLLGTIALIGALAGSLLMARRVTRPLGELASSIHALSGDIGAPARRLPVAGGEELEALAHGFNRMADRIQAALGGLRLSNDALEKRNREMHTVNEMLRLQARRLQTSRARYREMFESFTDVYYRTDIEGRISLISPSVYRIYGYAPRELIGKRTTLFYARAEERITLMRRLWREGEMRDYELELKSRDGRRQWTSVNIRLVSAADYRVCGIEGVLRDISERKRAEERQRIQQEQLRQADKFKSLGVLVSGVAHEINNPNNFISLSVDNMRAYWRRIENAVSSKGGSRGDLVAACEAFPRMIDAVAEGSRRINLIVRGLKDFARGDSGALNELVNVNRVVHSSSLICGNLIKKATNAFMVDLDGQAPYICGSEQQVEQVIINLITNACQALRSPDEQITIETGYDRAANKVIIRVRDQGAGIDPEVLTHLFDPFFTTRRSSGGTGIGLSISYAIIKKHRGDITMESVVGQGACATVSFPGATRRLWEGDHALCTS
jgi:PAS domain S-box-containing protein